MQLAYADWEAALIAATCGLIVVGTVLGNVLVCTTERYNRSYTRRLYIRNTPRYTGATVGRYS